MFAIIRDIFADRRDAGRQVAALLAGYAGRDDLLIAGLARGGVPVAAEVATALGAPLEAFVVRKLGVPDQPELALGAVASGGTVVLNADVIDAAGLDGKTVDAIAADALRELDRQERVLRPSSQLLPPRGRTVIVVDDGLATGASMRAAIQALREQGAAEVVAAVPVAPPETAAAIAELADHSVCVHTPEPFHSVGSWYREFPQVPDADVRALLADRTGDD